MAKVGRQEDKVAIGLAWVQGLGHFNTGQGFGLRRVDPRPPDRKSFRLGHTATRCIGASWLAEQGPGRALGLRRRVERQARPAFKALCRQQSTAKGRGNKANRQ